VAVWNPTGFEERRTHGGVITKSHAFLEATLLSEQELSLEFPGEQPLTADSLSQPGKTPRSKQTWNSYDTASTQV